jgi:uncharacterized protein YjdB
MEVWSDREGKMLKHNLCKVIGFAFLVLPFTGCSSSEIDSITITPTVTDFEGVGGSIQLTAIGKVGHGPYHPASYSDVTKLVTWSTPQVNVATVDATGNVTIAGLGLTAVNATIKGFTGVMSAAATVCATVPATATAASPLTCPVVTTPALRAGAALSLVRGVRHVDAPGETLQLRVVGTSSDSGLEEEMTDSVTWGSSNESVATVSRSGLVTAVGGGKATIVAKIVNQDLSAVAAAAVFTVGP